jgi:hypothetical protein
MAHARAKFYLLPQVYNVPGGRCGLTTWSIRFLGMRKRIGSQIPAEDKAEHEGWFNLEKEAEVEVTSEDPEHPIEYAFSAKDHSGWRAGTAGRQTLRLIFDSPQILRLIHLVFTEENESRTQEFVLRWSAGEGAPIKEILRQQYNLSLGSSEIEDYVVNLEGVKVLELEINPSIQGGEIRASLAELRLR